MSAQYVVAEADSVARGDRVDAGSPHFGRARPPGRVSVHRVLRRAPDEGWGIFWAGTVPQYGSIILHDITGLNEWWLYAALIPLAALWAAQEEREAHDKCTPAHDPGAGTSAAPQ